MAFFAGNLNKEHFIEANKQICKQTNEIYGLDKEEDLDSMITQIHSYDSIVNNKERLVKKISAIIGGPDTCNRSRMEIKEQRYQSAFYSYE